MHEPPNATALDTRPVRAGEELDWARLETWLHERLRASDLPELDLRDRMQVAQFPGGHSNLTYQIRFGSTELVVRRPPFGPIPPTAHDMAREYRWLSAVHPVFPLAPRVYALCEDSSIIGSVFYVMERRHGIVVRDEEPLPIQNKVEVGGESAWPRSTRWLTYTPSTLPRLVFRISANRTGLSSARCAAGAIGGTDRRHQRCPTWRHLRDGWSTRCHQIPHARRSSMAISSWTI